MLFGIKGNEQFYLKCNDITLKNSSHEKVLVVTIDNNLSFDDHIINICETANEKRNTLSRKNHYMKQGNIIVIISHFSYCPLIWMFRSKKSTKNINAVHGRSLWSFTNDV